MTLQNVLDFRKFKQAGQKISMVTCYDYWSAKIIAQSNVDVILVGDSVSMVVYGHPTTIPATTKMLTAHVGAVARAGCPQFLIADMPFLSFRKDLKSAMDCVAALMQAGAHAVKLEGVAGHENIIEHIVKSGVPVMGHLGLTPQSVFQLGGFKVQGKGDGEGAWLIAQAKKLEELGCFSIVLECVPSRLAKAVTAELTIPTIGIGAGVEVDGQVLVLQDLLGMNKEFRPKFVRTYCDGFEQIQSALNSFASDVKSVKFPSIEESY